MSSLNPMSDFSLGDAKFSSDEESAAEMTDGEMRDFELRMDAELASYALAPSEELALAPPTCDELKMLSAFRSVEALASLPEGEVDRLLVLVVRSAKWRAALRDILAIEGH